MRIHAVLLRALPAVLLACAGSAAQATVVTVNCGPILTLTNASGSAAASCPSFSTATGQPSSSGLTLNGVTLSYYADYGFGTTASNNIAVSFSPVGPGGVTWATPSLTINITGGLNSTATTPSIPVADEVIGGLDFANFGSRFNISVSSKPIAGGAASSSALATISYSYVTTVQPPSTVQEPTTLLLSLTAVAGVAAFGRRRRAG